MQPCLSIYQNKGLWIIKHTPTSKSLERTFWKIKMFWDKPTTISTAWPAFHNLIPPSSLIIYKMPFSKYELYFEFQKLKWTSGTTKYIPYVLPLTKYDFSESTFLLRSCLVCQVSAGSQFLLPGYKPLK